MAYKVFEFSILLILCVSSVWSLDICEDQLNGAQLLHPLDCSKYIVCRFGTTYRIETCDGGRHFNRLTAECTDPFEAACDIDLIKEQFVLSNECNTCRSICGCSPETQCSTPSSSTPDLSPQSTTTSSNPTLETSSSTTPSSDSSSTSISSSETTDQSSSTPAISSETTVGSHVSSGSTETTPYINSETTSTSITSPVTTDTTPNTSSANTSVTPALDTSSEVTVTTSPAENSSPTPHIPSPSTTDAATTRHSTPNPDISSSISPGSTTASSNSVTTTSETTSNPPNPETPTSTSPTPTTSACTNNLKICIGKPNFSIIYVPGSCREYAVCINDCANVLSCPNNLLYDLENHICNYPQNVKCSHELTPPTGPSAGPSGTKCESHGKCENQPDGALFADDSTGGYIVCQCECEVARPCPGGLVFNQESKVCDFPVIS